MIWPMPVPVTFIPGFMTLLALPFMQNWGVRNLSLGLFYIVAVSGVSIIGYIMAGFTNRKRALHDILADTLVIKSP